MQFTREDVIKAISELRIHSAAGPNGIPVILQQLTGTSSLHNVVPSKGHRSNTSHTQRDNNN